MTPTKPYTRKYIAMMETSITYFYTRFYIKAIQNLAFHLPYIRILGTNQYGNTFREAFKHHRANQDMLCHIDYADRALASFAHQTQSKYSGGSKSVFIEFI